MAGAHSNKPVLSRFRQLCLHVQHRQRAPFSCGLETQHRRRRHRKRGFPSCGALTIAQPVPQDSAGSALQSFSFSTYRDDGALSEVSIADCLDQETLQHQGGLKQSEPLASQRSLQSSANSSNLPPHAVQVSTSTVWLSCVLRPKERHFLFLPEAMHQTCTFACWASRLCSKQAKFACTKLVLLCCDFLAVWLCAVACHSAHAHVQHVLSAGEHGCRDCQAEAT